MCEICQRVREFAVKEIKDLEGMLERKVLGEDYLGPIGKFEVQSRRDTLKHILEKMK